MEEASEILEDGRRGVPYIVVLVTSGWQSSSDESIIPVEDAMERLQKLGAQTFVVAIAHDPGNTSAEILPVASFDELSFRVYDIARNIKVASGKKRKLMLLMLNGSCAMSKNESKKDIKQSHCSNSFHVSQCVERGRDVSLLVSFLEYQPG